MRHMLPIILQASVAGNRLGELRNLKWENVNFEEGYIKIVKPKEKKSKKIDIDPACGLYQMFKWLKESQKNLKEEEFKKNHFGYVYVYPNPRLGKWTRIPIDEHFLTIRREAEKVDPKIKGKTFHSFRHTAGSLALSAGSNEKAVQAIYGHSTVNMTQHYLHATREEKINVVKNNEKQLNIGGSDVEALVSQG